jgi:hypothetical protein
MVGGLVGKADDARPEDRDAFGVAVGGRRTSSNVPLGSVSMPEPTFADVDELVGPATPHFAYQLRARVRELVMDLADDHPVRQYAEEKMELLDRLGYASSKAADSRREPQTRPGWSELPSSATADEPLPRR